jgi:uncharacterized protein (DUF1015 family)
MPVVGPFRGILYDPAVVGPLERVVAPPYDVIDPAEQDRLYAASPYNVVRLDLSRDPDRYAEAARRYRQWLDSGVLRRDPQPAIYVYAQTYGLDGEELTRWGFFCRLRLEEFSSRRILPHEKTLDAAKNDRLALQRACRANLSAIFGIYSSPGWRLADAVGDRLGSDPVAVVEDRLGVRHRLWRVTDPAVHEQLALLLRDRTVYIADGHHRYETALRYRDERRAETGRSGGDEPFDYLLAFLANLDEPGLTILPTHRLLRDLVVPAGELAEKLRLSFRTEAVPRSAGTDALLAALRRVEPGERRIAAVFRDLREFLVVRFREGEEDRRIARAPALRRLDVSLLHDLVLEGEQSLLGLDARREAEAGRLVYTQDTRGGIARVLSGEFAAGFFLNATRVDEVRAVCEAGETMPEKSTYFYPKLLTGLVFHSVDD